MAQILTNNTPLHHGKYRIIRELGQGGFGVTYLAIDTEHKTQVAIKEYFPKIWCRRESGSTSITITHDEYQDLVMKGKQRFLKEAKNLNKLNSPDKNDIVKVYSAFEENHTAYYVMEYIPGTTLAKKVESVGKMNVKEAVIIMDQLCDAVSYIHSKRMTHYDLKPQNIIIRESNGRPVIIDFGLSKQYDSKGDATSSMMFAHSDGYSPIELYGSTLNDNVFSPQTDVYSLGAIMYFMLRGIRPPEASTLINHPLPSDNIPPYVYEVICKAMGYSKASRYPTVVAFKNDLDKAAKGINPFPTGEDTVIGNTTTYGSSTSNKGSNESGSTEEKDSIFKKYWWILGLAAVVALAIIFSRKDYERAPDSGPEVEIIPANDTVVAVETQDTITIVPLISTQATRNFSLSGYNYNEKFNLKAEDGILYVNSVRNGEKINEQFNYNKNVDAEKILDQFEGMANFWAATFVAPFVINDDGFYSEEVMESTLKFLKNGMEYMSTGKGNCPTAYASLKSWYNQFNAIHKDWLREDSPSSQKWAQWENDLEMLNFGMNENPIKPKDIYGL